ncbi:unnamed protein product [Closterium sp. NIES-65]|nr:unnamed protein product [Closterium sp. NIES-65]
MSAHSPAAAAAAAAASLIVCSSTEATRSKRALEPAHPLRRNGRRGSSSALAHQQAPQTAFKSHHKETGESNSGGMERGGERFRGRRLQAGRAWRGRVRARGLAHCSLLSWHVWAAVFSVAALLSSSSSGGVLFRPLQHSSSLSAPLQCCPLSSCKPRPYLSHYTPPFCPLPPSQPPRASHLPLLAQVLQQLKAEWGPAFPAAASWTSGAACDALVGVLCDEHDDFIQSLSLRDNQLNGDLPFFLNTLGSLTEFTPLLLPPVPILHHSLLSASDYLHEQSLSTSHPCRTSCLPIPPSLCPSLPLPSLCPSLPLPSLCPSLPLPSLCFSLPLPSLSPSLSPFLPSCTPAVLSSLIVTRSNKNPLAASLPPSLTLQHEAHCIASILSPGKITSVSQLQGNRLTGSLPVGLSELVLLSSLSVPPALPCHCP